MINSELMVVCNHTVNTTGKGSPSKCGHMDVYSHQTPYIVEAFVEPWIFSIALITNIVTLSTLRRMSAVAPSLKLILMSLCVSDGLACVFGFIYIVLEVIVYQGTVTYGRWTSGSVEVFTMYKVYLYFTGYSSLLLILGSIVKMYALTRPIKARVQMERKLIVKVMLLAIVITFLLFVPLSVYIVWKTCFRDYATQICVDFNRSVPDAEKVKYYFFTLAMFMGPGVLVANVACFIALKKAIKRSRRGLIRSSIVAATNCVAHNYKVLQAKRSSSINNIFLYALVIHSVCIIPSCVQIICLLVDPINLVFADNSLMVDVLDCVAEIFLALLPCYNFWLYLVVNKEFRNTFRSIFCRCLDKSDGGGGTVFTTGVNA